MEGYKIYVYSLNTNLIKIEAENMPTYQDTTTALNTGELTQRLF